ncbi:MAG: helix-turn-helix domain-containing protein [Bacteroidota bacterium]
MKHKNCDANVKALYDTLYVIGGKWKMPILASILSGNQRFREIERSIPKISTKVLSTNLKALEENLLITRTVYDDIPVRVVYAPTGYARTLDQVIREMVAWGKSHKNEIIKNRLQNVVQL